MVKTDDIAHGTVGGYTAGCKCAPCTGAWATYHREKRHALGGRTRVDQELEQAERELAKLDAEDTDVRLPVQLTPLGARILMHLQRRTQRRRGEIIDQLLRDRGAEMTIGA